MDSHKWALVVAHPGHELRAFHFLESARPLVSILTDGSGSTGVSRLHLTTSLLEDIRATPDGVYGCFTDAEAYRQLMARDDSSFVEAARQLRKSFQSHGITAVLTDAAEGYNPVHDLCRVLTEAGVRLCAPRAPLLFEIDLVGSPIGSGAGIRLTLDDRAFGRKLDAIGRYPPLAAEANAAFDLYGAEAFRIEFLRASTPFVLSPPEYVPHYERVGVERVRQGRYGSVLRFGDHVRPVLAGLLATAGESWPDGRTLTPRH